MIVDLLTEATERLKSIPPIEFDELKTDPETLMRLRRCAQSDGDALLLGAVGIRIGVHPFVPTGKFAKFLRGRFVGFLGEEDGGGDRHVGADSGLCG